MNLKSGFAILCTLLAGLALAVFPAGAAGQGDVVHVGKDGSLCLGSGPTAISPAAQIHDLLASQVQVYVFKSSSRLWPTPLAGGGRMPVVPGGRRPVTLRDPQIASLVEKHANRYGVDSRLVKAVMRHESGYNPAAVSPKGAMGLMQLMPGTASLMGVTDPFDVEQNIAGGVKYLKHCLTRFDYDVPKALAAYNAGPLNVEKYNGLPPFAETQNYVANVMHTYYGQPFYPAAKAPTPPAENAPGAAEGKREGKKAGAKTLTAKAGGVVAPQVGGRMRVNVSQSGKTKVISILR